MEQLEYTTNWARDLVLMYGPKFLLSVFTLIIGWWLTKRVVALIERAMERGQVEVTLRGFLASMAGILLKALLLISVASMIGIETTSFIAMLGAAGLAVGLALQGSLANFAGGVLILFFRPFKVGDLIEAQGFLGVVKEIQIFVTILTTLDNRRIIIPNGPLSNGCITNLNAESLRRVDMKFGISYGDDVLKAKEVIQRTLVADDRILKSPAPDVFVSEHADSSINFVVRPWVHPNDYWDVYFHVHEQLKLAFDREGITIPFPQRDVHLFKEIVSA
ncbi:MAG: mechanosensitive ion channel [Nitrospirales bacterium]|nr:mechanosensitive ion channel [Nitrospira sp.]MDR4500736.1 mechanosensitive ion channel [Nitrospirales bacterium]